MQNPLHRTLENSGKPIVFDADALHILAENKEGLHLIPKDAVLTPHPGEFDRLTQKHSSGFERCETQLQFSKQYQVIVVLKGAFTSITDTCGNVFFNSTGNPGMATGGSGDVLTGIILSLLAQGYKPIEAARFGVFLHGLAGDLAAEKVGFEALIASDIINNLGCAFKRIKKE
jgi:NAD(P)H-hydrate epimerase